MAAVTAIGCLVVLARGGFSVYQRCRTVATWGTTPVRWGVSVRLGERRVLHPGRWRWLRALGWLVLLFFLTGVAFGLPAQAAVDLLPPGNAALQLVGLLVAAATALGCYALAVWLGEGRGASELALQPALPGLAAGATLGLLLMSVLMGVLVATGAYDTTVVGATPAWTGLGLAVQAAVTEELWMRALLLRLLWRTFGPVPAFIVAALAFGALHWANPGATPLAGATVVVAGLMFCALYALTGRLWVPLGLHAAWNFAQGYLFGASVSGGTVGGSILRSTARPDAPVWLTGGTFGPEASVLALILVATVTVGALGFGPKGRSPDWVDRTSSTPQPAPLVNSGLRATMRARRAVLMGRQPRRSWVKAVRRPEASSRSAADAFPPGSCRGRRWARYKSIRFRPIAATAPSGLGDWFVSAGSCMSSADPAAARPSLLPAENEERATRGTGQSLVGHGLGQANRQSLGE